MRIALLSDVHGNAIALDAVLTDLQSRKPVDEVWVLGDLVAIGYDPVGVLERLSQIPNTHFVRGNTEDYITKGLGILHGLRLKPYESVAYLYLGELYADTGQTEKALDALKKAEAEFKDMGMDYWLRRTHEVLGRVQS